MTNRQKFPYFWLVGVVIVALLGVGGWFFMGKKEGGDTIHRAPLFVLKDRSGNDVSFRDFGGRVVIVHFWASWCAPCIEELPAVVRFAQKDPSQDVKFILISLDKTWADADSVLKSLDSGWEGSVTSLIDSELKVSEAFGSYQFPETYLISPEGEISTKWVGPQKWEHPYYRQAIESLLPHKS